LEPLHKLWEQYGAKVDFLVVYIREAHPEDGWVVNLNRDEDIGFLDPTNDDERLEAATSCAIRLKIRMPVVVDEIDDKIASAYGALPDRLYLIGKGGKVAYQGGEGPWGFDPNKLEEALKKAI
jgi:hypothetical protein